jgi:hypothetical protein
MFSIAIVRSPALALSLSKARRGIRWSIGFRIRLGLRGGPSPSRKSWTRLNAHLLRDIGESPDSAQIARLHYPLNAPLGLIGTDFDGRKWPH